MDPVTLLGLLYGAGYLGSKIFGDPGSQEEKLRQVPLYSPEQQSAMNQLLSSGLSGLQGLKPLSGQPDLSGFKPYEQAAQSRFEQQTVPSLAERFAGTGGSSGLNRSLAQAGRGLEQDLGLQRLLFGQQQQQHGLNVRGQELGNLYNMLGLGLGRQFEPIIQQRKPGFFESTAPTVLSAYLGNLGFPQMPNMGQIPQQSSAFQNLLYNQPSGMSSDQSARYFGFNNPQLRQENLFRGIL